MTTTVPAEVAELKLEERSPCAQFEPSFLALSGTSNGRPSMLIRLDASAALLGLTEGQTFGFINRDGKEERIRLQGVLYQPETARREREALRDRQLLGLAVLHDPPQLVPGFVPTQDAAIAVHLESLPAVGRARLEIHERRDAVRERVVHGRRVVGRRRTRPSGGVRPPFRWSNAPGSGGDAGI